jgi:HK97 family phage prohead protease
MTTRLLERRQVSSTLELRASTNGGPGKCGGYALKYGTRSQNLGGYMESITAGSCTRSLGQGGDVLCRYQHDSNLLLGRTLSETLRLSDDSTGLDYEADLPDTSYARDLAALLKRGDVRHSSFAFRVLPSGDSWGFTESGFPLRTLNELQIVDVAPVVTPAYLDTTSGLRSLAEQRGLDLDDVAKAAAADALGELMRAGAPVVIDLKTSDDGPPRHPHGLLAVRQLRADLYAKRSTL